MRSQTINAAAVLAALFVSLNVHAQSSDSHVGQTEALQHCQSSGASKSGSTEQWNVAFKQCTRTGNSYREDCDGWQNPGTTNTYYGTTNCSWLAAQIGNPGTVAWHNFTVLEPCAESEEHLQFFEELEPPSTCVDNCEFEATTGSCTDNPQADGYWCYFDMQPTGNSCTDPPPEQPENCVLNEITGVVSCDCSVDPDAWYCGDPEPEEDDFPPNCIENHSTGVLICTPWPEHDAPEEPGDVPENCYVSGTVMYCPPGVNPTPAPPVDTGPPGSPTNPGTDGGEDGVPGPAGPETPCTGSECDQENWTASTQNSCDDDPPACNGNAIHCAVLKQIWMSSCLVMNTGNLAAPWDDDPDWGRDPRSIEGGLTTFQASDFVGNHVSANGTCPAPIVVDAIGIAIEIDFQALCDWAGIIRIFVIIAAWLSAGWLYVRAFM